MLEMNSSSNSRYESNYKNFVESFNEGVEFLKYDNGYLKMTLVVKQETK